MFNSIVRMTGVAKHTVLKLLEDAGLGASQVYTCCPANTVVERMGKAKALREALANV
jgi:hypothetical protein